LSVAFIFAGFVSTTVSATCIRALLSELLLLITTRLNFCIHVFLDTQTTVLYDAFDYYRMTVSKSMVCMPVYDTWKINE